MNYTRRQHLREEKIAPSLSMGLTLTFVVCGHCDYQGLVASISHLTIFLARI